MRPEKPSSSSPVKTCRQCGTEFTRRADGGPQWRKRRFCSVACANVAQGGRAGAPIKACVGCGAMFERGQMKPSHWRRRRYCSHACYCARGEAVSFWERTTKTDGCWIWRGPIGRGGYGVTHDGDGHWMAAHRRAWLLARGTLPPAMDVLHGCDNRACVNPAHLRLGTAADNARDRARRWRGRRGESSSKPSRLHRRDIMRIRALAAAGVRQAALAESFGCTIHNISAVVRRVTWRHVAP